MAALRVIQSLQQLIRYLQSNMVSLTSTQTLTNKTLTSPTITGGTSSAKLATTSYTAAGAITYTSGSNAAVISGASAIAMTLASPTSTYNGTEIIIANTTAYAHTVTGTFYNGTSAAKTTITFPAYIGASIRLVSYGTYWIIEDYQNVTLA